MRNTIFLTLMVLLVTQPIFATEATDLYKQFVINENTDQYLKGTWQISEIPEDIKTTLTLSQLNSPSTTLNLFNDQVDILMSSSAVATFQATSSDNFNPTHFLIHPESPGVNMDVSDNEIPLPNYDDRWFEYNGYMWIEYNGHWYTLTQDYCTWDEAMSEAFSLGGHLAIFEDQDELEFLSEAFSGTSVRSQPYLNGLNSLIWIGLEFVSGDMCNKWDWQWIDGTPLTWSPQWWSGKPRCDAHASNHGYLSTNTHILQGSYWNNGPHDNDPIYHPFGLIELEPVEQVKIDIDPDTLNLKSKGKWITAYITFPEDCDLSTVHLETILFEGDIVAEKCELDEDNKTIMAKFARQAVVELLTDIPFQTSGEITLFISGEYMNGSFFEGTDTIRIIH